MKRHRKKPDAKPRVGTLEHMMRRDVGDVANATALPHEKPGFRFESQQQVSEYAKRIRAERALERSSKSEPEDRRTFHPERSDKPARTRWGGVARMTIAGVSSPKDRKVFAAAQRARRDGPRLGAFDPSSGVGVRAPAHTTLDDTRLSSRIKFQSPKHVWVCVKRKIRREVMHALKITGTGVHKRQPRRNKYSDITC